MRMKLAVAAVLAWSPVLASTGQAASPARPAKAAAATTAPTAPAGPRDFTGIWERFPDPFAGGVDYPPLPGGPVPLREPYAGDFAAAVKKRDATLKRGELADDPSTRCLPEGMPTIMGAIYALEFLQSPRQMVVLAEFFSQTRRIYINEKMPPADEIFPTYNGYSVAHWEGGTLVVETRGVKEDVRFMNIPHSTDMRITERIRRTGPDNIEDRIVIEDPKIMLKPYSFTFGYRRLKNYKVQENICENNRYKIGASGEPTLDTSDKPALPKP